MPDEDALGCRGNMDMIDHGHVQAGAIHQMNRERPERPGGNQLLKYPGPGIKNNCGWNFQQCRLAAPLARAALGADSASPGADHLVASAMRASDVHKHVAQGFGYPLGMGSAIR